MSIFEMDRRWYTPEDVAADLARAAGGRPKVDERYLLYGERPPPSRLSHDEDADIELPLGAVTSLQAPDLDGITHMLRMVQNYGEEETIVPTLMNDVIVISKLNPNVKEFVPKPGSIADCTQLDINSNTREQTKEDDKNSNASENIEDTYRKEKEELEAMLKTKIQSSAPPDVQDGFQLRREERCALAPPLRPLALRTPDYFRTAPARSPDLALDAEPDPTEVQASIRKVSDWFDSKPGVPCGLTPAPVAAPAPAPAPHLGPVTYKRKQRRPRPTSPSAPADAAARGAYVPSAQAGELARQYAARARSAQTPVRSVWDALEDELRRKDEVVKERRRSAADRFAAEAR